MLGSRTGLYRMVIVVKTAIVGYNTGRNLLQGMFKESNHETDTSRRSHSNQ